MGTSRSSQTNAQWCHYTKWVNVNEWVIWISIISWYGKNNYPRATCVCVCVCVCVCTPFVCGSTPAQWYHKNEECSTNINHTTWRCNIFVEHTRVERYIFFFLNDRSHLESVTRPVTYGMFSYKKQTQNHPKITTTTICSTTDYCHR